MAILVKIFGPCVLINSEAVSLTLSFLFSSIELEELSQQQFPAVFISTADETREDISIKNSGISRTGTIDYRIFGFVTNGSTTTSNIDTKRNELVTTIETALDTDRTRNGNALDTQVVSVETDEGSIFPYGGVIITVRCFYSFISGTP